MARAARVCSHVDRAGRGCPNLVPCPTHSRPANAPWSRHRPSSDRGKQRRLRAAVLERDDFTCTRCGLEDLTGRSLQVHHMRASDDYRPQHARILCDDCHRDIDHWAR